MTKRKKRTLVRYAGWDAGEHRETRARTPGLIDAERAQELRDTGLPWHDVGVVLAQETGRIYPFAADSVMAAVGRRKRREQRDDRLGDVGHDPRKRDT